MLNLLVKYAHDRDIVPLPGFGRKTVKWAIVCDNVGRYQGIVGLGNAEDPRNQGRMFPVCPELATFEVAGGSEPRSHFLIETAQVVALYFRDGEEEKEIEKVRGKHGFFVRLLRECSSALPEMAAVADTLDDDVTLQRIASDLRLKRAKPTDKVTLAVGSDYLVESTAWHTWWENFRRRLAGDKTSNEPMRCFATGQLAEPMAVLPKISGLSDVGGLPTGDALICFDKEAFRSYGLEQSTNGAVSENASSAFRAALNDLLRDHGARLAGAKVVHWFAGSVSTDDDPLGWLVEPAEQQELVAQERAARLLDSIRTGKRPDLSDNHYYALTVSGASGRVMVRDWMEGQFVDLVANIKAWFDDLDIVRRDGDVAARPPKFLAVVGSLVRDLADVPPALVTRMWRAAIDRGPIPRSALAQALARAKVDVIADQPANHARMGLMKAYHIRNSGGGIPMTTYLNKDHPSPAYQCGRLMAMLAALQRAALGDVGAGVVQRFYAAASATPALVLGRLTRASQFHLNKLDPRLAYWYESIIGEIWASVGDGVPNVLTLEEQSLFALGYYQQLAANRSKTPSAEENKKEETDV